MTNQLVVTIAQPQLFEQDGIVYTNSVHVSNISGRRHDNITRSIRRLLKSVGADQHFVETRYVETHQGHTAIYTAFNMTRVGFTLLAMSFVGDKALDFKLRYIMAFDAMEKQAKVALPAPSGAQLREVRRALDGFTSLSPASQQALAVTLYGAIGIVLPDPVLPTAKFYTSTELAARHGYAPSMFGKLPAVKALKVSGANGEMRLTTTPHGKQIEQFYWSQTGADAVDAALRMPYLRLLD